MSTCEWCSGQIYTVHYHSFAFSGRQGYFCSERCLAEAQNRGILGTQHPKPQAAPSSSGCLVFLVVFIAFGTLTLTLAL